MRQRATSRNLFGFLTKKTVTYQRTRGDASPSIRAYRAGVQSGDTGGFDSWLAKQPGVRDAGRPTIDRLEKQYRRGVERSGVAERARAKKATRKEKRVAGQLTRQEIESNAREMREFQTGLQEEWAYERGADAKKAGRKPAPVASYTLVGAKQTLGARKAAKLAQKHYMAGYRENPEQCAVTRRSHVTDRAKRYRANQPGCRPGGAKKCTLCGRSRDLMVDHKDGDESNGRKSNLRWLCRSCNTLRGAEMARTGQGHRTVQYNPGGAKTLGEYVEAVLQHTRGAHDAGGKIIHETPKSKRREFASQIWAARKGRESGGDYYAENPGGFESIKPGSRVTIVNRFGQQHTGRAIMRGPHGWVLNMGGRHGTPAIASPENVVKVTGGGTRREFLEAGSYGNPEEFGAPGPAPFEVALLAAAAPNPEELALASQLSRELEREGLVDDSGKRTIELVIRRLGLSEREGRQIVQRTGRVPATGQDIARIVKSFTEEERAHMERTALERINALGHFENPTPSGSPHFQAGYRWLVAKRRTSKGSFLTTPGADQYLRKHGMEGTLAIRAPYGNDSVRQRVQLAETMRREFLDGAEAAWNDLLAKQHPGDDIPNPYNIATPPGQVDEGISYGTELGQKDALAGKRKKSPRSLGIGTQGHIGPKSLKAYKEAYSRSYDATRATMAAPAGERVNPHKHWGFGVFAQDTRSQFLSSDQVAWFTRAKEAKAFAEEHNDALRAAGEWYSQAKPHYQVRKAFRQGATNPTASIYDYEDATRAGRDRASELIRQTGIPSKSARTIQKATLVRDFGAWWTHGGGSEYAQPPDKSGNLAAFIRGFKGSRNPEQTDPGNPDEEYKQSLKIAELFHGRAVKEEITVTEMIREHDWLWRIGPLVSLTIKPLTGGTFEIPFHESDDKMVHLFCSPDGRQFYLRGGDQELDLEAIGMGERSEWFRDLMLIGEAKEITYQDKKKFHRFKLIDYYHKLGEVTKKKPMLAYDSLAKRLNILGGQYRVETEELVDGMSPGIVN